MSKELAALLTWTEEYAPKTHSWSLDTCIHILGERLGLDKNTAKARLAELVETDRLGFVEDPTLPGLILLAFTLDGLMEAHEHVLAPTIRPYRGSGGRA